MGKYDASKELVPLDSIRVVAGSHTIGHYTSIQTLFRILRNQTIRFNRIDHVNDFEEKERLSYDENFRRVFISCFTYHLRESIPMWKMYTVAKTGVMLKITFKSGKSSDDLFDSEEFFTESGQLLPSSNMTSAPQYIQYNHYKVMYTDKQKLSPFMSVSAENNCYCVPHFFGVEKSTAWKYEHELRYRAIIKNNIANPDEQIKNENALYAKINLQAIEKIIVTFNPWTDKKDWEDILKMYIQETQIPVKFVFKNSSLFEKIR